MKARDEILTILKMVQDGKITNEDAAKLIDAIEGNDDKNKKSESGAAYSKEKNKNNFEQKMEEMAEGLENMVTDVVDSTKKALENIPDINFGNWFNNVEKREFSYEAYPGMDIDINSKNGAVKVKPGRDKIDVVFHIYTKNDADEKMKDIVVEHSKDKLLIDTSGVTGGAGIEVRIPELKYGEFKLSGKNGSMECSPVEADSVELVTKNGSMRFAGVRSKVLKALTRNGSITCAGTTADRAGLNTTNGSITVRDSECTLLDINTTNGSIRYHSSKSDNLQANTSNASINAENFNTLGDKGIMNLKTSNGNVRIKLPDDVGAMFNAHAGRSGKVVVDFPCSINKDMEYAGMTKGYEEAASKINITARTNLGRIEIT